MKIRRMIAREGLILLGVVILGLGIYFTARHWNDVYLSRQHQARIKVVRNMRYSLAGYEPYMNMMSLGTGIAVFGYPVLGIVRFVVWAVRILRRK